MDPLPLDDGAFELEGFLASDNHHQQHHQHQHQHQHQQHPPPHHLPNLHEQHLNMHQNNRQPYMSPSVMHSGGYSTAPSIQSYQPPMHMQQQQYNNASAPSNHLSNQGPGGGMDNGGFEGGSTAGGSEGGNSSKGTAEERKRKKLERNREVARMNRYRKRAKTSALEEENARLREINQRLELQLKLRMNQLGVATSGRSGRDAQEEAKRAADVDHIAKLIELKSNNEEIRKRLDYYKQTYSDFGKERNSLVGVHLEQIKALMLPNQVSKVLMWLFQQDDAFYAEDNKTSLWNVIRTTLNLTPEQNVKVAAVREHFRGRREVLQKSLGMVVELHNQLKSDFTSRLGLMRNFETLLDTTQEAKFLVWVENNKACVHLLNTMWMDVEGTPVQVAGSEVVATNGAAAASSSSNSATAGQGAAANVQDSAMASVIASAMASAGAMANASVKVGEDTPDGQVQSKNRAKRAKVAQNRTTS